MIPEMRSSEVSRLGHTLSSLPDNSLMGVLRVKLAVSDRLPDSVKT